MDRHVLKAIMRLRRLSQSDIAKMSGVTRQAVSLWLRDGSGSNGDFINLKTQVLKNLAQNLELEDPGVLLKKLFEERVIEKFKQYETGLLWDKLFPGVVELVTEALHGDFRAIARFVQVFGLFESAKLLGEGVWHKFHAYKKYILGVRRKECEQIWTLQKNLALI